MVLKCICNGKLELINNDVIWEEDQDTLINEFSCTVCKKEYKVIYSLDTIECLTCNEPIEFCSCPTLGSRISDEDILESEIDED